MNINWDEMPEWADSYCAIDKDNRVWMNDSQYQYVDTGDSYMFHGDSAHDLHDTVGNRIYPPNKQWRGPEDGLPPVGTVCELSNCGQDYNEAEILFTGNLYCIVKHKYNPEQHYYLSSVKFRPLISDKEKWVEQVKEKWREKHKEYRPPGTSWDFIYDCLQSGEIPMPEVKK